MSRIRNIRIFLLMVVAGCWPVMAYADPIELRAAVEAALRTNPEINQAVENKAAIEFERKQAEGLFLPRISVEASAGVRRLENATRRSLGIASEELYPIEAGVRLQQLLFDAGASRNEVKRQAARTDGAAFRVEERAQFIALQVTRQYLDYMLQQRIVAASEDNIAFHERLVGDLREGVSKGSISIADQQQGEERLQAARARVTEARQDLADTASSFRTLTGLELIDGAVLPQSVAPSIPAAIEDAIRVTRAQNPKIKLAQADLDAANALLTKAKAERGPRFSIEGNARIGDDIDGFRGETNDLQLGAVMRWDVFNGGINQAKVGELDRRFREAGYRLEQASREAEEDVRIAWNAWDAQGKLVAELDSQSKVSNDLLRSYREQFNVGRRSLLDVLDAQNTRYNVQVRAETARFAQFFSEFKVLASQSTLIQAMQLTPPPSAEATARAQYDVKTATVTEDDDR